MINNVRSETKAAPTASIALKRARRENSVTSNDELPGKTVPDTTDNARALRLHGQIEAK